MTSYPDSLPLQSVNLLIAKLRMREEVPADRLCHAAWEVAGYALRVSVGQPVPVFGLGGPATGSGLADALEAASTGLDIDGVGAIPWATIAIELVRLLVEWRLRR